MGKMINEEELMHYGVMGMRWGVRRASKRSVGSKKGKKKKASRQPQQPKRRMSNKELQSRVKRMKLEKQYRELTSELIPKEKSKIEKLISTAETVGKLSTSALLIYKNLNQFAELSAKKKKG